MEIVYRKSIIGLSITDFVRDKVQADCHLGFIIYWEPDLSKLSDNMSELGDFVQSMVDHTPVVQGIVRN